jgi:hypothetical protein
MALTSGLITLGAASVAALLIIKHFRASKCHAPLPPGPPGYPLIGNLFDFPDEERWLTYTQWAKQYGACAFVWL